jgi:hypothetical protein
MQILGLGRKNASGCCGEGPRRNPCGGEACLAPAHGPPQNNTNPGELNSNGKYWMKNGA